ncbi:hypothetical protein R1flu_016348 [Riccia fluitans]|uniref:Small nuclear ribonucleoprotein G n=1 Tax=Riccia fluitans TaxID=41844 RepID=A0ABD1YPP2_9MARC
MSKSGQPPDLKKYMDRKLNIKLNANRVVVGVLRGFDQFMNLVLDNTVEINGTERNEIGMVRSRVSAEVSVLRAKRVFLRIQEHGGKIIIPISAGFEQKITYMSTKDAAI